MDKALAVVTEELGKLGVQVQTFDAREGKAVALLGVAAGRIGAIKSLEHLRSVCAHMGAVVMAGAVSIAAVDRAFDANGLVVDAGTEKALCGMAGSFSQFIHDYILPKIILEEMARGESPTPWVTTV
jgi:chromate reductase, NAD(P)H dehydrogenase (quinone)